MSTIGSLYVDIGASTSGFHKSMLETTTAMDRLAQSSVDIEVGLDSSRAMKDVENLKKKVSSSSAVMKVGSAGAPKVPMDTFGELGDILLEAATNFEAKMIKAIDLMVAKLRTATIGHGKGGDIFVAALKGATRYVSRLGEAKIAWETVRDAEMRAGKTAEEAARSADVLQASSVASASSGLTKLVKGLDQIKKRVVIAFSGMRDFKATNILQGLGQLGEKLGAVGQIAGKMLTPLVDIGGKAINFIGNNIGKVVGVLVVGAAAIYASWKAISAVFSVVQSLASAVMSVFAGIGSIVGSIVGIFGSVIDVVGSLAESLGAVIGAVYEIGAAVVAQIYAPFDYVFGKIGDMWGSVYDTIMSGFASIKGYILGALTAATLAWLGKIAWDSGVFGRGLKGLEMMFNGGKEAVVRKDAGGEVIEEGGFLQRVADKSAASIQKFFDTVQKMFGVFFSTTWDIVGIVADKVSKTIDWVTSQMQAWIGVAIDVAIKFLGMVDSTIGIFLALFQGDWSGAGAMALDVVAKVADGMASVVKLVATPLDFIVDNFVKFVGQVLSWLGENGKNIESVVFQVLGQVLNVIRKVAEVVVDVMATINAGTMGAIDNFRNAFPTVTSLIEGTFEPNVSAPESTLLQDTTQAIYNKSVGALDKMGIIASKLLGGGYKGMATDWLKSAGKDLEEKGAKGLGTAKMVQDVLEKLAESSRNKRDELDPNAISKFGGTTDPIVAALNDLKKSLGLGAVVDPKGRLIDNDEANKDLANGGGNTLSVDTALGTVKLAGSFDKTAMLAKNALTEAQKQTMILEQTQKIIGDIGKNGDRFVQVKDASGADVSMSRLLTKLETRVDIADSTKKVTSIVPLMGEELAKRLADIKLLAESQLGGSKDLTGIDYEGMMKSLPTVLVDEVARASSISDASKVRFAEGGDPEQRKLTQQTNEILKKIANSKSGKPFS